MVLAELGQKLTGALKKLNQASTVDDKTIKACLNEIAIALLQADVNVELVKKMKNDITMTFGMTQESGSDLRKMILGSVVESLTGMLSADRKPFEPKKGKTNIIMLVGLQGSGKTTTCTKLAYHYKKKNFRVCLVCADTFRAGAFDQLKQNATKVRIPFYGSYTETDPVAIAKEGVEQFKKEGFEIIIVDTSGRHRQEDDLFEEMKQVEKVVNPDETIFVMDSSIGQACKEQATAFKEAVRVGSVIVTKLDGHSKGGGAISAVSATNSPIVFIGTGEHFNDFESFNSESFVRRLLGLGDLKRLFETIKDVVPQEGQEEMMENLLKKNFSFKTMQTLYNSTLQLGSMNSFMSMIPGIGSQLAGAVNEKEGTAKIKRYLCVMDSMTQDELNLKKPLDDSRIRRLARGKIILFKILLGAGVHVDNITMLMAEFKQTKKMIEGMGSMGMAGGKNGNMDMKNMMRNPKQMAQMLGNKMDPRMLQQFGGAEGMMDMMKNIGGMGGKDGGMGGLQDMMSGMGGGGGGMPDMKQIQQMAASMGMGGGGGKKGKK